MPQFNKGESFADGQQVTGVRLNNLIDGATILSGAITDQTNITANTVASGDSILLYDLSATALREANVSDVLGSNVPVTTSVVTAGANSDIFITPNDGTIVIGQAYTSGNGLTVTVTSPAHLLTVGQVILVTSAGTGYNGTFRVATVLTNSFTYEMTTAATAGGGLLSYTKKGSVRNAGNETVDGSLFVAGSTVLSGATTSITGTITGPTTISGNLTSSGTANFTGALQVNGTVGYVLTEIVEETMTPWNSPSTGTFNSIWSSALYTKPSNEMWIFEADFHFESQMGAGSMYGFRYSDQTFLTGQYKALQIVWSYANDPLLIHHQTKRWVEGIGTTLSSVSVRVDTGVKQYATMGMFKTTSSSYPWLGAVWGAGATFTISLAPSKLRIYKYKTA